MHTKRTHKILTRRGESVHTHTHTHAHSCWIAHESAMGEIKFSWTGNNYENISP